MVSQNVTTKRTCCMASNVDPMTRKEVVIKKIREQNKAHGFVLCFAISPVMKRVIYIIRL